MSYHFWSGRLGRQRCLGHRDGHRKDGRVGASVAWWNQGGIQLGIPNRAEKQETVVMADDQGVGRASGHRFATQRWKSTAQRVQGPSWAALAVHVAAQAKEAPLSIEEMAVSPSGSQLAPDGPGVEVKQGMMALRFDGQLLHEDAVGLGVLVEEGEELRGGTTGVAIRRVKAMGDEGEASLGVAQQGPVFPSHH